MKHVLGAVALAACGAVSAQGYIGALAGMSSIASTNNCYTGVTCDSTDTGMKIYGGYQIAPELALEVAYTSFGEYKASGIGGVASMDVSAFSIGGAFRAPITTRIQGVLRLGMAGLYAEGNGAAAGFTSSATKAYIGGGAEYTLSNDLKIIGGVDVTDGGDIYLFGVGAQVGF